MSDFKDFFGNGGSQFEPPVPVYGAPELMGVALASGAFLIGDGARHFVCGNHVASSGANIVLKTTSTGNTVAAVATSAFAGAPETKFRNFVAYDDATGRLYVLIGEASTQLGYINGTSGAATVVGLLGTPIPSGSGFMEIVGANVRIWHNNGNVYTFAKTGGAVTVTAAPYPGLSNYVVAAGDLSVSLSIHGTYEYKHVAVAGKYGRCSMARFFNPTPLPVAQLGGNTVNTAGLDGACVYVGANRIAVTSANASNPASGGVYTRASFDAYVESLVRGMFP